MEHRLTNVDGGVTKTKCPQNNKIAQHHRGDFAFGAFCGAPGRVGGVKAAKGCESLPTPHRPNVTSRFGKLAREAERAEGRRGSGAGGREGMCKMLAAAVKVSGPRLSTATRQVGRWRDDRGARKTDSEVGERRRGIGRGSKRAVGDR